MKFLVVALAMISATAARTMTVGLSLEYLATHSLSLSQVVNACPFTIWYFILIYDVFANQPFTLGRRYAPAKKVTGARINTYYHFVAFHLCWWTARSGNRVGTL
jgi:hypothetical protein